MGIDPEQASHWPKSRQLADAVAVRWAVVFEDASGLHAEYWNGTEQDADARAVWHQQQGCRAWYVLLEGPGVVERE